MVNPEIFQKTIKQLKSKPDLNYFVSRLNTQLLKYISYRQDTYAYLIDAFSVYWGLYKCYVFPPFSLLGNPSKNSQGSNTGCSCSSKVANSALVQQFSGIVISGTICHDLTQRKSTSTTKTRVTAPLVTETNTSDREGVREVFLSEGFDNDNLNILMESYGKDTYSNYSLYMSKWFKFASCNKVSPVAPPVQVALAFLILLFRYGKSFNQICMARSAFPSVINQRQNISFG